MDGPSSSKAGSEPVIPRQPGTANIRNTSTYTMAKLSAPATNPARLPTPSNATSKAGTSASAPIKPPGGFGASGNSIVVNQRQRGNPVLQSIRSVPWEFGNVLPDYVLGVSSCALFLSLKYHNLNPEYIHERLKSLGRSYELQVLLVLVDVKEPHHPLKELAKIAILSDVTLIPAWSPEEAGKYLELYKIYENKPADMIRAQVEGDYMSQLTEALTTVKSVNKTDVKTLSNNFKSLAAMADLSKDELSLLPGFGMQKAKRVYDTLHQPFLKNRDARRANGSPEI